MYHMPSSNETRSKFTRRGFLRGLAAIGSAVVASQVDLTGAFATLKLEKAAWSKELLQQELEKAISVSIETKREVTVELPEGEILVDKTITVVVPKEAKIRMVGHQNGSMLKLDEKLSNIPKEYYSFAQHSLLFFKDMEGELAIDGIYFDGGSKIAGKGGYKPPRSPWNSVLFIDGKGPGDSFDPAMDRWQERRGKATIRNCTFTNSEAGGILVQNLSDAQVNSCAGQNLDALLIATWTNNVYSNNMQAENCLSDGAYITNAQHVELKKWIVKKARQGYEIQGAVDQATLEQCYADNCGVAYVCKESETGSKTPSREIALRNSDSKDCLIIFSIGNVRDLVIENSRHDGAGGMRPGFFDVTDLPPQSIFIDGDPPGRRITFENVEVRKSKTSPPKYLLTKALGVTNYSYSILVPLIMR